MVEQARPAMAATLLLCRKERNMHSRSTTAPNVSPASSSVRASDDVIILVGNPNVGKSAIFGHLTGSYVNVSNYPGTTVEVTRGTVRLNGAAATVIDTPGANSLTPMSEDELVTRSILLDLPSATVLQVADMKNIRRALVLTAQLTDLERTGGLALNMADEAMSKGIQLDLGALEVMTGVPVHRTVAIRKVGVREVAEASVTGRRFSLHIRYPGPIEEAISQIGGLLPSDLVGKRGIALMILGGDETVGKWLRSRVPREVLSRCEAIRESVRVLYAQGVSSVLNNHRLSEIDRLLASVMRWERRSDNPVMQAFTNWSTHPVEGLVLLGATLYFTLWFVGLFGAGTMVNFFETFVFGQYVSPACIRLVDQVLPFPHEHVLETSNWVFALPITAGHEWKLFTVTRVVPGTAYAIPAGVSLAWWQLGFRYVHDFIVGPYGAVTMAIAYGFAIVLPIVATFFTLFSVLEDSGYLPRLAVMTNRAFRAMGLNGKAVLPMVLGLGCDTMATMSARILETKKERVITTLLLALGVPCSAQLGVILAMTASISMVGVLWWLITVAAVMIAVGWLAAKVIPGESSDLVLELPPMRVPQIGNILMKTVARIEWYLKEVVPLFVLGTAVLFFLDAFHALKAIERLAAPLVQGWLGLPAKATEAFLIGFLRRDYGAAGLLHLQVAGQMNEAQVVVSLITITLFVPCIANVFMIAKERGIRAAVWMTAFIFPFAFFVGGVVRYLIAASGAIPVH